MIFLALRYLSARRRQTLFTLLGIFFGTAAFVSISGFMLGFQEYLVNQLVNNSPHIHIRAREEFLEEHSLDQSFYKNIFEHIFWDPPPSGRKDNAIVENPQSWYLLLKADSRVLAYSPQLSANVIFSNGKSTASAVLIGCDPLQQKNVTNIADYVSEGNFSDLAAGGNRVMIGNELKKKLGLRLTQNVLVSLANGNPSLFKVAAVFKTGNILTDNTAYGEISAVQKVNGTPNQVNEIGVRLNDYTQAAKIAETWSNIKEDKVESWDQVNANILNVFRVQDTVRYLSVGSILVVAAFGIYNVLNMTVSQKRKDIAILRSMGYSGGNIISLFFSQGLLLGFTGALLGLTFGYFFCLYLQTLPFAGGALGGPGHFTISFNPRIYFQAIALALLSSSLASILPSRAAGKLSPIEIIRSGAD